MDNNIRNLPYELLIKDYLRLDLNNVEDVNTTLDSLVEDHLDYLRSDFKIFLKENEDNWDFKCEVECDFPEDSETVTIESKYVITNLFDLFDEYASNFNFNVITPIEKEEFILSTHFHVLNKKLYRVAILCLMELLNLIN